MSWTFTIGNLSFGIFDLILLGIVLISGISGFVTGFSNFAFKSLGYVLTFPLSLLFVGTLSSFLSTKINIAPIWISLISYIILCLVIFSLFKLVGVLLSTALSGLSLGWFDSFLGLIVSTAIALFLTFIILELASLQTFVSLLPLKENSFFYMNVYLPLFPSIEKAFKGAIIGL